MNAFSANQKSKIKVMNKKTFHLLFIAAMFFITTNMHAQVDRSKAPAPGPAPKIQIGDYQLFTLENGLKVIVVENHKLPRVSYSVTVDFDPILEKDKAGYVGFAGQIMASGTTSQTKSQIDEAVDFLGASFSTSSSNMFGSCLKKHADKLLAIMSDVLLHPAFPQDELDKVRKLSISGLASEKTDPDALSGKITSVMNFGAYHPYGEFQTEASLNAITRDDLASFYKAYWKPNISYLVIVGDITPDEAKRQAIQYFGTWQKGEAPMHNYTMPTTPAGNKVVFVPMPGAVQSVIDITYPIQLRTGTVDAITASVLNTIFGGSGFQTRLMQNLREDKAFTYGAYSSISPDDVVGSFSSTASVRNEVTDSAIVEFLYEMNRMVKEKVADSTLQTVKNIMTGSFARSLERPQTVANFALNIEKYHLPKDFYETYLQKLNAVTVQAVQDAAIQFIRPENAHITVVGNREVAEKLRRFAKSGRVEILNADGSKIVEMKPAPAGVTAESVLLNYINAIGGEKELMKIKSYEQKGTMSMAAIPMPLEMNIKMKDQKKIASSFKMQGMEVIKQVFDGTTGTMSQMGQNMPMEEGMMTDMKTQADLVSELHYSNYGITATLAGIEVVDGEEVYVVNLQKPGGAMSTEYFHRTSGLKVKSVSTQEMMGESMTSETTFKEYLTLKNGVRFPSHIIQVAGGQTMDIKTTDVVLNAKLTDADFMVK